MPMVLTLISTRLENLYQKSDRVKELFKDIFIPSAEDWAELRDKVQADGLYHQNRLGCRTKWIYQLHQ